MEALLNDELLDVGTIPSRTAFEGIAVVGSEGPLPVGPFADEVRLTLRDEDEELVAVWPGLAYSPTATLTPSGIALRAGDAIELRFEDGVSPHDVYLAWEARDAAGEGVTAFSEDVTFDGAILRATVPTDAPRGNVILTAFNNCNVEARLCDDFVTCKPVRRDVDLEFDVVVE